jgi:hypothetical protein
MSRRYDRASLPLVLLAQLLVLPDGNILTLIAEAHIIGVYNVSMEIDKGKEDLLW